VRRTGHEVGFNGCGRRGLGRSTKKNMAVITSSDARGALYRRESGMGVVRRAGFGLWAQKESLRS
jgi:hypothetical protein